MCISVEEVDDLRRIASDGGRRLGVNHNFLFSRAYQRLRRLFIQERSGCSTMSHSINSSNSHRFGSVLDTWMLRAPGNVVLETGPHLISALLDLVGTPEGLSVTADRNVALPGGVRVFRRWRIHTTVGRTAVDININLGPGFGQRTINVRGQNGSAVVDFDANTCTVDRRTSLSFDLDRYSRSRSLARQIHSQARTTLADYLLSIVKLRHRGAPYQGTFLDSVESFYASVATNTALDNRIDGGTGRNVIEWCNKIVQAAGVAAANPS